MSSNSNNGKNDVFQNIADRLFNGNRSLTFALFWVGVFTVPWLIVLAIIIFGRRSSGQQYNWNRPIHYNTPQPPPRPKYTQPGQAPGQTPPPKRPVQTQQTPPPKRPAQTQQTLPPQPWQTQTKQASAKTQPPKPPQPKMTGDAQADHLLGAGYQFLCEAEPLLPEMGDPQVRKKAGSICQKVQLIMDWVQKNPASAGNVGRLASYYLPTTLKLFHSYVLVDDRPGPNAQNICAQVDRALTTLEQALANLQDDLLGNTALDVEAEINAMEMMLCREGLTDDFRISSFEENIKNLQQP